MLTGLLMYTGAYYSFSYINWEIIYDTCQPLSF